MNLKTHPLLKTMTTRGDSEKIPIQATGSYDVLTKEYSFSICSGELAVTFEFLKKKDIEHFISCLTCMLCNDEY